MLLTVQDTKNNDAPLPPGTIVYISKKGRGVYVGAKPCWTQKTDHRIEFADGVKTLKLFGTTTSWRLLMTADEARQAEEIAGNFASGRSGAMSVSGFASGRSAAVSVAREKEYVDFCAHAGSAKLAMCKGSHQSVFVPGVTPQ